MDREAGKGCSFQVSYKVIGLLWSTRYGADSRQLDEVKELPVCRRVLSLDNEESMNRPKHEDIEKSEVQSWMNPLENGQKQEPMRV